MSGKLKTPSRLTIPEFAPTEATFIMVRRWCFRSASRFLNSRRLKPENSFGKEGEIKGRLTIPEFAPTEASSSSSTLLSPVTRLTIPEFAPTEAGLEHLRNLLMNSRLTIPEFAPTEALTGRDCNSVQPSASRFLNSRRLKRNNPSQQSRCRDRLTIPEFAPTEARQCWLIASPSLCRLTIPEFAPTEAHPCRQPYFPLRFAAVGER